MFCRQQINQNNIPSKAVKHYWKRSVKPPFFDVAFADMKPHFIQKKRDLIINVCRLIPEVFKELDENTTNKLHQFLIGKWDLFMLLLAYIFDNWSDEDLFEYVNYDLILITCILNQDADATFAPSILLKILRFFHVGSVESRKVFFPYKLDRA